MTILKYSISYMVFTFVRICRKRSRRLHKDEVDLQVGNGAIYDALVVRTYYLTLQRGMILELDNCYFVSIFSTNIMSILL